MVLNPSMGSNDSSQQHHQPAVDGPVFGPIEEQPEGLEQNLAQQDNEPKVQIVEVNQVIQQQPQQEEALGHMEDQAAAVVENNDLAIVPYHPPLQPPLFVGAAKVVLGPVLPQEMIWQRTF